MPNLPESDDPKYQHFYALLGIATVLIAALFWLFTVNATAERADHNASSAMNKLDTKVDKERFEQMENDVRDIKNCLLNGKCGK